VKLLFIINFPLIQHQMFIPEIKQLLFGNQVHQNEGYSLQEVNTCSVVLIIWIANIALSD